MTTWIATTQDNKLADRTSDIESTNATTAADLQLDGNEYQALRGFGGCFNELGWLPLQNVSEAERDQIIKELFSPDEMNFTFNRAPVGANDFADHWYSYDEVDGDYGMEHFSVEHDEQTLIPYIHRAQEWQPNMQLFSSPWSPPTWMKRPKAYNYGRLVQTPENLKAYAKYFVKYIQAYAEHGITVNQLHVQNEVFADQKFPSALWDSEALKVFIRDYLGPAFDEAGLDTDIWLGTLNGPEDMAWTGGGYGMTLNNYNRFVDNILFDDGARKYIKGIAYQWAGQNCIARTHESWPEIELIPVGVRMRHRRQQLGVRGVHLPSDQPLLPQRRHRIHLLEHDPRRPGFHMGLVAELPVHHHRRQARSAPQSGILRDAPLLALRQARREGARHHRPLQLDGHRLPQPGRHGGGRGAERPRRGAPVRIRRSRCRRTRLQGNACSAFVQHLRAGLSRSDTASARA